MRPTVCFVLTKPPSSRCSCLHLPRAALVAAGGNLACWPAGLPAEPPTLTISGLSRLHVLGAFVRQVFFYNLMGWPLPVDPKKDEDATVEDAATKQLAGANEGSDVRRRKTTGGVTKVESVAQWKALLKVCRFATASRESACAILMGRFLARVSRDACARAGRRHAASASWQSAYARMVGRFLGKGMT